MSTLDIRNRILLLGALFALASVSPGFAQSAPKKPSKPLNLLTAARGVRVAQAGTAPKQARPAASPAGKTDGSSKSAPSAAQNVSASDRAAAQSSKSTSPQGNPSDVDTARFCSNIADAATDARMAWQMKELEKVEAQLRQRIAELEAKRAEYEQWLKLREDFLKKAQENVVDIYTRMRPEQAAEQIASMNDETAAAVLAKLNPRNASAIFNEMETVRAANLANMLGGMRRTDDGKTNK